LKLSTFGEAKQTKEECQSWNNSSQGSHALTQTHFESIDYNTILRFGSINSFI